MYISVVIPMYGCRAAIPELHRRLVETLVQITDEFEIIMVDDYCPQNSWGDIEKLCDKDSRVKGVKLSRNFGQIKAITAGLDLCKGDWVVVMDCDLQDRPESILQLYDKAIEGYDVVFASRNDRKDSFMTLVLSKLFYKVYGYFTEGNYDPSLCNFSISNRKVVDSYCRMREQTRAFTMFIKWLGFRQTSVVVDADARYEGMSSYTLKRKIRLAFDIITTQSNKPLVFAVRAGFTVAVFAMIYILYLVARYFFAGDLLAGWATAIASIYLMGGLLLCAVGVLGLYVGNIFNETKNRPIYVIDKLINGEN